jgi:hypothetical protein
VSSDFTRLRDEERRWAEVEQRYAKRFPGWTQMRTVTCYQHHVCPLALIGRPRNRCPFEGVAELYRVFDHGRVWSLPDGTRCISGEPYRGAVSDKHFVELLLACERYGLWSTVSDDSPYNGDGSTMLILIEACAR